eukprot:PhM_4_TR5179/c0_g1_i1/m.27020
MQFNRVEIPQQHKYNLRLSYEKDQTPQKSVTDTFAASSLMMSGVKSPVPTLHGPALRRIRRTDQSTPQPGHGRYLFFPSNVPKGPTPGEMTLVPLHALVNSPRYERSMKLLSARRDYKKDATALLQPEAFRGLVKPLLARAGIDGLLTSAQFQAAMTEMGLSELQSNRRPGPPSRGDTQRLSLKVPLWERLQLDLDLFAEAGVRLTAVLPALHELLYGECMVELTSVMFTLFAPNVNAFILKSSLTEIKAKRQFHDSRITPVMIKALTEAFAVMSREEEDKYVSTVILKGKKKKRKKPPALKSNCKSYFPLDYKTKQHMSLSEFRGYYERCTSLAQAFLPVAVMYMMENPGVHAIVHMAVKKSLDDAAAERERVAAEEAAAREVVSPSPSSVNVTIVDDGGS